MIIRRHTYDGSLQRLATMILGARRGERGRSKFGKTAAYQSHCTGRQRRLYRPRLAQELCLRERQQLVEWAPVSSMPICGYELIGQRREISASIRR
jgi:hypothetical protein